jgi:hypothetical protein
MSEVIMQATLLLLPALTAFCYGAALPQSFVTGTTLSAPTSAEPTFTFVIPCLPLETGCFPRTVTIDERDTPEPTFGFGIPSESIAFGDGVTETAVILPRQSLVTGTTISVPQETFTFVIPCYSGEESCVPRTVTLEGRDPEPQTLGSISRSASIPLILPATTSTTAQKQHHWKPKPKSTIDIIIATEGDASRSATVYARQTLVGSPSRDVPVWPPGPSVTVTVTLTSTAQPPSSTATFSEPVTNTTSTTDTVLTTPGSKPSVPPTTSSASGVSRSASTDQDSSSTYSVDTADITGVLTARQVLGSPTRVVLEWPYPTVTVTTTVYVTATYVPPAIWTSIGPPPPATISSSTTSDESTWTGAEVSTSLPVLTVTVAKDKRQILGEPTRSVIWH